MGFIKGFFEEVFGIVAVFGGILFSSMAGHSVGNLLNTFIPGDKLPYFLGYILAFLVIFISAKFLAKAIGKLITVIQLKNVDRLMGALIGLIKGSIIIAMLLTALVMYPVQHLSSLVANSKICQSVLTEDNLNQLKTTIIPKIKQTIDEGKDLIEKNLDLTDTPNKDQPPETTEPPQKNKFK